MTLEELTEQAREVVDYTTQRAKPDDGPGATWILFEQAGPVDGLADALSLGVPLPGHLRAAVDRIVADLDPVAEADLHERLTDALAHASK